MKVAPVAQPRFLKIPPPLSLALFLAPLHLRSRAQAQAHHTRPTRTNARSPFCGERARKSARSARARRVNGQRNVASANVESVLFEFEKEEGRYTRAFSMCAYTYNNNIELLIVPVHCSCVFARELLAAAHASSVIVAKREKKR